MIRRPSRSTYVFVPRTAEYYRIPGSRFILSYMDRSAELLRLEKEVVVATAECTAALNEQFLAVLRGDPDVSSLEAKVAQAGKKRKLAMGSLINHIREHGW